VTDIGHRRRRRISLVASTAALVLLGGGIGSAAAAQQAMPGDALYGMKRGIENVSTNVSVGDESRGRRELEHAMTRLAEVRALVEEGGDVATIDSTLDAFSTQARRGVSRLVASYQQEGDKASITAVTTFITGARLEIAELAPKLPAESLKSAVEALATIDQLARHTSAACPSCDKPKVVSTEGPSKVTSPPDSDPSAEPGGTTTTGVTALPTLPSLQSTNPSPLAPTTSIPPNDPRTPALPTVQVPTSPKPSQPSDDPTDSNPTLSIPSLPSTPWPYPTLTIPGLPLPCLPLLGPCS